MYGLLLESIAEFAKRLYGTAVWDKVRKKAKIDNVSFSSHHQYSETLFQKIMKILADVTDQEKDSLMEMLGIEFVDFVSQFGYDRILRVLGRHMRDFLNGLDNLHEYMRFSYQKLKPPSFFVEKETADGIVLHYRSKRKDYKYYVRGQLKQVAKVFYNLDVVIDVLSEDLEGDTTHVVFKLNFENTEFDKVVSKSNASMTSIRKSQAHSEATALPIKSEIFFNLFPFHIVFKPSLEIISIGEGLNQAMTHSCGESIKDLFNLNRPLVSFTWDNIISHTNNVFEISTIEPISRSADANDLSLMKTSSKYGQQTEVNPDQTLKLRGQMLFIEEWHAIIFLATPVLENLDVMFTTGFYINDLSMHDSSRDLVLVGTQQSSELKLALDQEKHKSKALEDSMRKLDVEMKKTDQLLYQMIPKKVADRLRGGEAVMNLCEVVSSCTILFSDVVGFTRTCSMLAPMEVVTMLNSMYTKFDRALEKHDVYKVETIGDAYMVVSGLPEKTNNHAQNIVDMAFDMLNAIATLPNPATGEPMKIRVGCHSGPVVAGVVGLKMPRYCLFGDTVNTASRMESNSEAMKIHLSHSTMTLLNANKYVLVERGKMQVKGKGEMKTYFCLAKKDERGKQIRCPFEDILEDYAKKNPHLVNKIQEKEPEAEKFTKTEEKLYDSSLPPIGRPDSSMQINAENNAKKYERKESPWIMNRATSQVASFISSSLKSETCNSRISNNLNTSISSNHSSNHSSKCRSSSSISSSEILELPHNLCTNNDQVTETELELDRVPDDELDNTSFGSADDESINSIIEEYKKFESEGKTLDFRRNSITDFHQLDFNHDQELTSLHQPLPHQKGPKDNVDRASPVHRCANSISCEIL